MARLILDTDAYGSRGQLSLLADFFELCCWSTRRQLSKEDMADYIRDREIRIPLHQKVPLDVEAEPEIPDETEPIDHMAGIDARRIRAGQDSARVFALLNERKRYLGKAYPFNIDSSGRLLRRARVPVAYDVALSLALRHGCMRDIKAPNDFESFVARCLQAGRYRVFGLSAEVRSTSGAGAARFRTVFAKARTKLGLSGASLAQIPEHIHDGRGDVLARWEPVDDRPGCRTLLVQATVGKAETWERKAQEPQRRLWSSILGDPINPLVTLAVPHHVEFEHLKELVENADGATVLDRLRLVAHRPKLVEGERASVRALLAGGVEW